MSPSALWTNPSSFSWLTMDTLLSRPEGARLVPARPAWISTKIRRSGLSGDGPGQGQNWPKPCPHPPTVVLSRCMPDPTDAILGEARSIADLRAQIRRLAAFDTPGMLRAPTVLVEGETGTGKGLVARIVHESGGRRGGPFVGVNCAAIPEAMLEAGVFGFEGGAVTDAKRAKPGLFEAASGGTLFLDEIDSLSPALQGKVLKAIEEKRVRRLGAVAARDVDLKLLAATQRDLRGLVAAGTFRADLYHRLAVLIPPIPPLGDREGDVVRLAEHFLARHAAAYGVEAKRLAAGAREWLAAYDWPGNVRELEHLMERVTLLGPDAGIDRDVLERLGATVALAPAPPAAGTGAAEPDEAARIHRALARSGGNVVRAARLLGLGRNALRYRMRRLGIDRPDVESGAESPPAATSPPAAVRAESDAPAAPAWEQKPVCVLAVALALPQSAAEPWTAAMRWEQAIAEKVEGFGGVLLQRSPAGLRAAFGVPLAIEQMAERTVQAALAIQRLAAQSEGPRPELRLAVHAGEVRVDTGASDPASLLLPLGDTLALPERLLGHAGRGEVLASAQIARRIDRTCVLAPRPLRLGPDDADGVTAYAVLGLQSRAATDAASAGATRFVGRAREVEVLEEAFGRALAGQGQVVFVAGDAGIGKSRLLAEFRRRIADTPHRWTEGRCASYGTRTPFLPVIDGLRRHLGIDDEDDEASATAKITREIERLGTDLAWTGPFIQQLLSLGTVDDVRSLDSASRRSETFRALRAITLRMAELEPLIVLAEDIHWIDPASEEYLAFVADVVPAARILLVLSHRSGYRHPFGDRSYHQRVSLRPLSDGEMSAMAGAILGTTDIPPAVDALIARKAEGNPFFVEELTRWLLEDGSLRRENGGVVLSRALPEIALPDTIHDVLIARIDRLAEESRRAIQIASVIGREFALRLLARITEAGERIRTQVEELRGLELIYEKAMHPELAYMFKHALTHDVAYESVAGDRRKALHRTIGLAIEELYADRLAEHYETLALHFGRAEDWERALDYHERSAEKAAQAYANRAVVEHCEEALAVAERLGERVPPERRRRLHERLGRAHFYLNEFTAAGAAHEVAATHSADAETRAIHTASAGFALLWGPRYEPARRCIDAAREIARQGGSPAAEALATAVHGYYRGVIEGDVEEVRRCLDGALATCVRHPHEYVESQVRFKLVMAAEWRGDYRDAIALAEPALALGRRLRLPEVIIFTIWFLAKA